MKLKNVLIVAVVAAALIAAQIAFGKKAPDADGSAKPAAGAPVVPETAESGSPAGPVAKTPPFGPAEAVRIELGHDDAPPSVILALNDGSWTVATLRDAQADADRVRRFLDDLLLTPAVPVPVGASGEGPAGRRWSGGIRAGVTARDGERHEVVLGPRPEGSFDQTLVELPGGERALIPADLRGDIGVWKNRPEAAPASEFWLERRILRFNPEEAVRLEAIYPDHRMVFEKSAEDGWKCLSYIPGGVWRSEALAEWLADLAEFTVGGLAVDDAEDSAPSGGSAAPTIAVTLADGETRTIRVEADHAGGDMRVRVSHRPGWAFSLPEWRFRKYFQRMRSLFPGATPAFAASDIRFIDIRRGAESVKVARRDDAWTAATLPFPLRAERVDRLARLLASLRPEDYASPDSKGIRSTYGVPMVEVTLNNHEVSQYRLAGRHPIFPWRYVVVNNAVILAVSDVEAGDMFPEFSEILYLGRVFGGLERENIAEVELRDAHGVRLLTIRADSGGGWTALNDNRERGLTPGEADTLVDEIADWEIAGFYVTRRGEDVPMYQVLVTDADGGSRIIELFTPHERDIPFVTADEMGFLIDRADFFNWLGEMSRIGRELDEEAAREAAEREAAEREIAEREAAEREAAEREAAEREAAEREAAEREAAEREAAEREEAEREAVRREAEAMDAEPREEAEATEESETEESGADAETPVPGDVEFEPVPVEPLVEDDIVFEDLTIAEPEEDVSEAAQDDAPEGGSATALENAAGDSLEAMSEDPPTPAAEVAEALPPETPGAPPPEEVLEESPDPVESSAPPDEPLPDEGAEPADAVAPAPGEDGETDPEETPRLENKI